MLGSSGTIRVFVSSTFRDMHAERDHLVTTVFPELRERLGRLGIDFFDVDLRWGVPESGVDGETANSWNYCRQSIDRIEPFFIGILGERYGHVPPLTASEVVPARGSPLSITEMEIRHAVLGRTALFRRSYFYLRAQPVPPPPATDEHIYREFVDVEHENRLAELKDAIRRSGRPARRYPCRWTGARFEDLDSFGRLVLEDLWSGVLRDPRHVSPDAWLRVRGRVPGTDPMYRDESAPVPPEVCEQIVAHVRPASPDPMDAEAQAMVAFGASRLQWFQGREEELEALVRFATTQEASAATEPESRLAVVRSGAGMGKTTLLARLSQSLSQMGAFAITHFVGATQQSTHTRSFLVRIHRELDRARIAVTNERIESTASFESLRRGLAHRLTAHQGEPRVVLIVDGFDQFDSGDVRWLPTELGPGVRIVVSCNDDPPTDESESRGRALAALETLTPKPMFRKLGPITEENVRTIVVSYLAEYCKELDPTSLDLICAMPFARSPLYLLVMLQEMRTLGGDDINRDVPRLVSEMERSYPTTAHLFDWVLKRLDVFGAEAVGLWCTYMTLGRNGMTSRELRGLLARKLGGSGDLAASRIERGLRRYLTYQEQQLNFFHRELAAAARSRLTGDVFEHHRDIARYFEESAVGAEEERALSELPFHLHRAREYGELIDRVAASRTLKTCCSRLGLEATLGHLRLCIDAVPHLGPPAAAGKILAAWGLAFEFSETDTPRRARELTKGGRFKEATRVAAMARSPDERMRLLIDLSNEALDAGRIEDAREVLRVLGRGLGVPRRSRLAEYLRVLDRLLSAGHPDALAHLAAPTPEATAENVLFYAIGSGTLSDEAVLEILHVLDVHRTSFWSSVCLVFVGCRAARAGTRHGDDIVKRLRRCFADMQPGDERNELLQIAARNFRWLTGLGLRRRDLGIRVGASPAGAFTRSFTPRAWKGTRTSDFSFLPADAEPPSDTNPRFRTVLELALGELADRGTVAEWTIRSFAPPDTPGSFGPIRLPPGFRSLSAPERLVQLSMLSRAGAGSTVEEFVQEWEHETRGTDSAAELFRTIGGLPRWEGGRDAILSASKRLKASSTRPVSAVLELSKALLVHGCNAEARFWLNFLVAAIAPSRSPLRETPRSEHTAAAYLALSAAMPPAPSSLDEEVGQHANGEATRLVNENAGIAGTLRSDFGLATTPTGYLGDRIAAWWVEEAGWGLRDGRESLALFERLLRIGTIRDDRERKRSWHFWLLVLCDEGKAEMLERWRAGVTKARTEPLEFEKRIERALLGHADPSDDRSASLASLIDVLARAPRDFDDIVNQRLPEAVQREFVDVSDQASAMTRLAELAARLGDEDRAVRWLQTADALAPGARRLAEPRVLVALGAARNRHDVLRSVDASIARPAFEDILARRTDSADTPGTLALMEFLPDLPESWQILLLALCRLRFEGQSGDDLARALTPFLLENN